MLNFFFDNNLIWPNQTGFKPGDIKMNEVLRAN